MKNAAAGSPEKRSECYVEVAPRNRGGIDVAMKSKVASLYGRTILGLVHEVLDSLGVRHARVRIQDQGALPFVIAARVETAVRRSHPLIRGEFLTPARTIAAAPERERMRRTRLYLPGNQPKFFPNAGLHRPDCIILDLEDSVHPGEKDAARILVRNALRSLDFHGAERMVRINQGRTGLEDLQAVMPALPDVIVIPKCESPDQVQEVEYEAHRALRTRGLAREFYLLPIIESALGVEHAYAIASTTERVCGLSIGLEDYTADIGAERTADGRESLYARQRLLNAARAAGIQALDSVFSDVDDEVGLARSCREARSMGFDGKGCIHPRQIAVIHEAFQPTDREIAWSQQVVLAFEAAQKDRSSVVAVGSRMIDPPVVRRALRQMAQAIAAGKVSPGWRRHVDRIPEQKDAEIPLAEGE